jgi:membrane associated rhomboid family serine protease
MYDRRVLIPLRTDAPVHHRPWATGGLVVANVGVQIWAATSYASDVAPFVLRYGRWAPWQWLTSVFLHAGWIHLVGNMIFLWLFGLVVEGKIGAARFLALYAAIAVATGAFEQTVMLGAKGGSLGASGVIYGLVAIAAVWAPENDVECLFVFFPAVREIDVSILTLAFLYCGLQLLWVVLGGFAMGSAALHLIGAAAGLLIGVQMVKRGWVDCEGWDWFSRRGAQAAPTWAKRPTPAPPAAPAPVRARTAPAMTDDAAPADESPPPPKVDAPPVVVDEVAARLDETSRLLRERRPSKAAEVLRSIADRLEDDAQRRSYADLVAETQRQRADGVLELDD